MRPPYIDTIHVFYSDGLTLTRTCSLLTAGWLIVEGLAMIIAVVRERITRQREKSGRYENV